MLIIKNIIYGDNVRVLDFQCEPIRGGGGGGGGRGGRYNIILSDLLEGEIITGKKHTQSPNIWCTFGPAKIYLCCNDVDVVAVIINESKVSHYVQ